MKSLKIFLLILFFSTLVFGRVNFIQKIEITKGELKLSFGNDFDKKSIKHFTLSRPFRQVFDFPHLQISSKMSQKLPKYLKISQFRPNTVRVVIYHTKAYRATAYQPRGTKRRYYISLPSKYCKVITQKPKRVRQATIPSVKTSHKYERIVIDAGHGGHDSGAIAGGKKEKDVVLQIAKRTKRALERRGYAVYLTRSNDRFLKLTERTQIADHRKAKLFISIHANSVPKRKWNKISGVETFFLQNTRDAKSQRVAERENRSVLKGTTQLSRNVILDSVLSGPKIVESNKLALDVHKRMMYNLSSRYSNVRDGGVRHAPFWVLVGASRPSILVEVGYISHPKERQRLFSSSYQELIAKGISEGVTNYFRNRKKEIDF